MRVTDKFSKQKRSEIMSRIRSRDTKPELTLRRALWARGHRYRVHYGPYHIDIAFPGKRVAVFVDGDFWHGYNWKRKGKVPPKKYWQAKIQRNIDRDRRYNRELRKQGWRVVRVWEHQLKKGLNTAITKIESALVGQDGRKV